MSEGPGFLEFFILEASDYVEQLDGLLLGGSSAGPDADAMQRVARALRGTATMAKFPTFAEVAAGVERVGRAMQEGVLRWDPALSGALVAAVDDLKTLLHAARTWSPAEDRRAAWRTAELSQFAPVRPFTPTREQANQRGAIPGSAFLATEAANIAAGLELLSTRAGAPDTAANLLRRVRALRGVAGVKAVAPLADVLEMAEDVTRGLDSGERTLSSEAQQLLEASAEYLRVIASALRFEGDVDAPSAARDSFAAAQTKWANLADAGERVVPISTLFYGDDGPGVVEASPTPPTSTEDRFRLELVGHGEHLRQVLDAMREGDASGQSRARRELARALRDLEAAARSFGRPDVAEFVATHVGAAARADSASLAALDELASILSQPGAHAERLSAKSAKREEPSVQSHAAAAPEPQTAVEPELATEPEASIESEPVRQPVAEPAHEPEPETVSPPATPTPAQAIVAAASALIDLSLEALDSLTSTPWIAPAEIPEDAVVPIETLLYRGNSALDRAIEIRDELRRSESPNDEDALEELFDLLELARAG
jgi:chemotaxis protein histidine kinase CheA